jgi:hypothetical protein
MITDYPLSMQIIGIGYNPRKIATPPKSWKEPKLK